MEKVDKKLEKDSKGNPIVILLIDNDTKAGEFYPFDELAFVRTPVPWFSSPRKDDQDRVKFILHSEYSYIERKFIGSTRDLTRDLLEYTEEPFDRLPEITYEIDGEVFWSSRKGLIYPIEEFPIRGEQLSLLRFAKNRLDK